jgi:hypothetical protein
MSRTSDCWQSVLYVRWCPENEVCRRLHMDVVNLTLFRRAELLSILDVTSFSGKMDRAHPPQIRPAGITFSSTSGNLVIPLQGNYGMQDLAGRVYSSDRTVFVGPIPHFLHGAR